MVRALEVSVGDYWAAGLLGPRISAVKGVGVCKTKELLFGLGMWGLASVSSELHKVNGGQHGGVE